MSPFRRGGGGKKRDANEKGIVEALERHGAYVFRLSGTGVPDLLVCWRGRWTPLEVKSPEGRTTQAQRDVMHAGITIHRVQTVEDALMVIGAMPAPVMLPPPAPIWRPKKWLR